MKRKFLKNSISLLFLISHILKIISLDSYISISKNCNYESNKNINYNTNNNDTIINQPEENILDKYTDISISIKPIDEEKFYLIKGDLLNDNEKTIINKFETQILISSNNFTISDLNLHFEFTELYTKENLILKIFPINKINVHNFYCNFYLKRVFWDKQKEYDFTIELRDRKEAFDFGLLIIYKNKEEYLRKINNYISILVLEGEKKCGKTEITSKLSNNTKIMLDYSLHTEGISGILENKMLFVDSEGLGTEKSNCLFNNTLNDFNGEKNINKLNINYNDDLIMEVHNENQRNIIFQTYLREAIRNIGNFYILIQNNINLYSLNHLEEIIQKHLLSEKNNELRVMIVFNYKDIDLVSKVKRKIYNDIISRNKVQPIQTNQKINDDVRVYVDIFHKLLGNANIKITYLVLGQFGKESGNYYNEETLGYITNQAKNIINYEIFDPIKKLISNLNDIFRDNINFYNSNIKNLKEEDMVNLKCIELKNFGNSEKLKNLEKIIFSQNPICRSIWEGTLKNSHSLSYEIYYQKSILNLDVYLPEIRSLEEIEIKTIDFSKYNFGNVHKIVVKANLNHKNDNPIHDRIDFIRQKRMKNFVIEEIIRLGFNFKNKKIVNTCDYALQNGLLKIKCPLIE